MVGLWAALVPLVAAVSTADAARPACPESEDIAYTAAPHCVGKARKVAGRIDHVSRNRSGITFVNFCVDWKTCPFTGVVFPAKAQAFSFLPRLAGSEVVVSGTITQFQGRAQIVLDDPSQVVARNPPPRPAAPIVVAPPPVVAKAEPEPPPVHHARAIAPLREPEPPAEGSGSDASPIVEKAPEIRAPPPAEPARPLTAVLPPVKDEPLRAVVIAPPRPALEPVAKPVAAAKPVVEDPPEEVARGAVTEAAKLVGRKAHLKGQVSRLDFNGGELVVYFKAGSKEAAFVAVVAESDVERMQRAAESWDGKTVELEGDVRLYDGRPGMFVREPSQVRLVQPRAAR